MIISFAQDLAQKFLAALSALFHPHQLLTHRKEKHIETVPECKSVVKKQICEYKEKCHFRHEFLKNPKTPQNKVNPDVSKSTNHTKNQNFWEVPRISRPPDQMKEIKSMMQTMMSDIALLKKKINN